MLKRTFPGSSMRWNAVRQSLLPATRIVPEAHRRQAEIDKAIAGIKALRRQTGRISLDELLSARREGHKY